MKQETIEKLYVSLLRPIYNFFVKTPIPKVYGLENLIRDDSGENLTPESNIKNLIKQGPLIIVPNHLTHQDGPLAVLNGLLSQNYHFSDLNFWAEFGMVIPSKARNYVKKTYTRKKGLGYLTTLLFAPLLASFLRDMGGLPVYPSKKEFKGGIGIRERMKKNMQTIKYTAQDLAKNNATYVIFGEDPKSRNGTGVADSFRAGLFYLINSTLEYQQKNSLNLGLKIIPMTISLKLDKIMISKPIEYTEQINRKNKNSVGEIIIKSMRNSMDYLNNPNLCS